MEMQSFSDLKLRIIPWGLVIIAGLVGYVWEHYWYKDPLESKTLVMGSSLDYPPFEFVDKNGNNGGFDIELAELIAKDLKFNLVVKNMPFPSLLPALHNKEIDFVASAMAPTADRAVNADFTMIYDEGSAALVTFKTGRLADVTNADDLWKIKDIKIGVQVGTTMEVYANNKQKEMDWIDVVSITSASELLEQLKLLKVNAIIINKYVATKIANDNSPFRYLVIRDFEDNKAIALQKGSELTVRFNKVIGELRNTGRLKELSNKWIVTTSLDESPTTSSVTTSQDNSGATSQTSQATTAPQRESAEGK
ncbi:amino acid ABC transporter substrate-binding protein [Rickettsiales endosymbiont of Peranema trichophorum]|uniref:ABC transporter substrate-binding protein n=1 Tax=Rickettsiales endosymbiont of Peranema trichophorum TaxID=2486577 RepID=UPI0010235C0A|nr:ABC transporter substrate-binding protein [Rickettsiales endosymbiont of Peranema trichophorum]RZI45090.1 amino acid ABC transporter substrate-binding protein [Rickettsiales endosymbiont of Peranema trichophorum]